MVATKSLPLPRCQVCSIPLGAPGTCATCLTRGAYQVTCGCGFLYADEPCAGHPDICIQCGGPDPDEHGACASCTTWSRWVPACSGCHKEVATVYDLSAAGLCARCFVASMAACTEADHAQTITHAWDSLRNPRPWPGTGLQIAECPHCNSTLAREDAFQRNTDAIDDLFADVREAVAS